MARESQELKIALIVFVLLTILLGVTTFIFSKEYSKAKALAADADKKASEANTALQQAESENMQIKALVGHPETATLEAVTTQFNTDMLTFASNFSGGEMKTYRLVCQWLFKEVQDKNAQLSAEKQRLQEQKNWVATQERAKDNQIKQWQDRAQKAEQDLAARQAEFQKSQLLLASTNTKLGEDKNNILKQSQAELAKAATEKAERDKQIQNQESYIQKLHTTIDDMDPPVVDQPDGVVTHAGRGNTVSINLGRAHGLQRLTNFSVYARDMTDVTKAGRKGAIEVIDVFDDSAVAQIVEDEISNPILAGDKIFTPLWKPGEQQHFALTCGIDLDNDGRSDIDEVRNIITSNGGAVDFWLDDAGQRFGQITPDTRYLVEGKRPTEGSTTERLNARKWIVDEAKNRSFRTMSLDELLNRMGYVRKVHVVRYDSKANPADFRAQPPEGVPRVSSGTVSDLYRKEEPPKPVINSAY